MSVPVPYGYRLLFAYIEPLMTLVGFMYGFFFQDDYYRAILPGSPAKVIDDAARVLVSHLANVFLVLSLISCLVWRHTSDMQILGDLTLALLVGDVGHLYAIAAVQGKAFLVNYRQWNAVAVGNILMTVSRTTVLSIAM